MKMYQSIVDIVNKLLQGWTFVVRLRYRKLYLQKITQHWGFLC